MTWARGQFGIDITIGSRARAFKSSRCTVRSALANGFDQPKSSIRRLALGRESDANILAWIKKQEDKSAAVARTNIKNYWCEVTVHLASFRRMTRKEKFPG
jgi:hypothetical protein